MAEKKEKFIVTYLKIAVPLVIPNILLQKFVFPMFN